jgi:Holliday junction DNA helicase RuvA
MIGYLKGKVLEVGPESAVILCAGVGYEILAPLTTLAEMQAQQYASKETELWIHTHVREDALSLFGFLSVTEKKFFLTLLKVNGIGPKMAVNILSGASFDQICEMIETEDVKGLSKLPKVGKKTAEQMVLTLKGKLVLAPEANGSGNGNGKSAQAKKLSEIHSALVNLGFRTQDVELVVGKMPADINFQEGLREALASLTIN